MLALDRGYSLREYLPRILELAAVVTDNIQIDCQKTANLFQIEG